MNGIVPGIGVGTEIALTFAVVALVALLVFRRTEGSRSAAQRRVNRSAKSAVLGAGFGIVGVLMALFGAVDGIADVVGELFGLVASHPGFLTNLSLGGVALGVATGWLPASPMTVGILVVVIIVVGIGWSRS